MLNYRSTTFPLYIKVTATFPSVIITKIVNPVQAVSEGCYNSVWQVFFANQLNIVIK